MPVFTFVFHLNKATFRQQHFFLGVLYLLLNYFLHPFLSECPLKVRERLVPSFPQSSEDSRTLFLRLLGFELLIAKLSFLSGELAPGSLSSSKEPGVLGHTGLFVGHCVLERYRALLPCYACHPFLPEKWRWL